MRHSLLPLVCFTLALQLAAGDCPRGCPKRCPAPADVQSDRVKRDFDLQRFWGVYYEIAFHDSTQPSTWPIKASCQRSVKSADPSNPRGYKDLFSLNEGPGKGVNVVCDLEFDVTEQPGVFIGHWRSRSIFNPNLTNIVNTLVDVGMSENGTYSWALEFQCKEDDDAEKGIRFAAVNFYHKNPLIDQAEVDVMMRSLRDQGLGWIAQVAPGLTFVDQMKCIEHDSYPPHNAKPSLCGQSSQTLTRPVPQSLGCPAFLKPVCEMANSTFCVLSCMPHLGSCLTDPACFNSIKDMGLCMREMQKRNASADEVQACLVPDNRKRSEFVHCLMDDPGCVSVPMPPSRYPTCEDSRLRGDTRFAMQNILGDWHKVKGWKKGELVECLPCQQVKFWRYSPQKPLPSPSPQPPEHTENAYVVMSSAWREPDSRGRLWPMNQTSLWGPRPRGIGFPGKEYSLGIMFGLGYKENYTVVHDGSQTSEPFLVLYACGETRQGQYVSGLVLARQRTVSSALQRNISQILVANGFEADDWCDVDNACQETITDLLL